MKKITVILSGVGISGYSGIALMEFFEKYDLKPHVLVGCSTGALIAALWAKGLSAKEALEIVREVFAASIKKKVNFWTTLYFFRSPRSKYSKNHAFLKPNHLQQLYRDIFKNQHIEHLPTRIIFQTTNIDTGETYLLRKGLLADAVYAASAILPFYPAININNQWLADGVFSEAFPLLAVLEEEAELIVATDIQAPKEKNPKSFMSYYSQFVQSSLKLASAHRTALVYDLHHDEILIVPIKLLNIQETASVETLEQAIQFSRESIASKEQTILETLNL